MIYCRNPGQKQKDSEEVIAVIEAEGDGSLDQGISGDGERWACYILKTDLASLADPLDIF